MTSQRVYFGLLGLVGLLLIGLVGGAYGVNKLLVTKSDTLVALKQQTATLSAQQTGLKKAKTEVSTYGPLNNIAESIVPQDKDQAQAVREISNLATQSGIAQLSSVTFPVSTLGGTLSAGTTAVTPPVSSARNNLTQLTAVKGISGLYQLPITIQQNPDNPVAYAKFLNFLGRLEQNRRTAQVSSISIKPDSDDPSLIGFTLTINEFIRP